MLLIFQTMPHFLQRAVCFIGEWYSLCKIILQVQFANLFLPTLTCGVFVFSSVSAPPSSSSRPPLLPRHSLTHTHHWLTHSHHSLSLTHSHSLTHTLTLTLSHSHSLTLTHSHSLTLTHTHSLSLTHSHAHHSLTHITHTHLIRTILANFDVECILRAKHTSVNLTGVGQWHDPRNCDMFPANRLWKRYSKMALKSVLKLKFGLKIVGKRHAGSGLSR